MSKLLTRDLIAQQARIVDAPGIGHNRPQPECDRTFELPKSLYLATVGLYLGFLAVMWMGLSAPDLAIPMVIFVAFVTAGFGVPAIWTRLNPQTSARQTTFAQLRQRGIQTLTGHCKAKDAAIQMLILPVIIFCWGVTTITIAALVR